MENTIWNHYTYSELPVTIDSAAVCTVYLQAHRNGEAQPVAMLRLDVEQESAPGWIGPLFVVEELRGCGLGGALLEKAFEVAQRYGLKTVGLSVKRTNEGARRLYDRMGFLPHLSGAQEGYCQMVRVL